MNGGRWLTHRISSPGLTEKAVHIHRGFFAMSGDWAQDSLGVPIRFMPSGLKRFQRAESLRLALPSHQDGRMVQLWRR